MSFSFSGFLDSRVEISEIPTIAFYGKFGLSPHVVLIPFAFSIFLSIIFLMLLKVPLESAGFLAPLE